MNVVNSNKKLGMLSVTVYSFYYGCVADLKFLSKKGIRNLELT